MNGILGHLVACIQASWFGPDQFALLAVETKLFGPYRIIIEGLFQAMREQMLNGVRQQAEADAEFFDLLSRFKYPDPEAGFMEFQRQTQADNARANDDAFGVWFHDLKLPCV
jgi:hypothetical protein